MLEYLLLFPDKSDAETVSEELLGEEAFDDVRVVREALAGEDDSEDHEWGVYVRVSTMGDPTSAAAKALGERFRGLASEHDGWLDEHV